MTLELVLYSRAKQALEEARTFDEVKDIRDKAVALQAYARQALDPELISKATEIRVRAERRAGEMLRQMREQGLRRAKGGDQRSSQVSGLAMLKDAGVSKQQSSRWQHLSEISLEEFERRLERMKATQAWSVDTFLSSIDHTAEKKARRAAHEEQLAAKIRALPNKRYGLILADPEWRFVPWSEETGSDRSAANHYATSALDQIKKRDVPSIAADDCVLALWATVPMLPQALEVMEAWGFDYRSHIVWLKNRISTGYWFRNTHELLLIGVKGSVPAPAPGTQWESAFDADVGEHSEKPELAYEMLEAYFPTLPKIELNAKPPKRDGWDVWGAEAPVDLEAAQ